MLFCTAVPLFHEAQPHKLSWALDASKSSDSWSRFASRAKDYKLEFLGAKAPLGLTGVIN